MSDKSDIDFEDFNHLVNGIYDAALDAEQWRPFMRQLVEMFNAKSCMLRIQHITEQQVGGWISHNMDPAFQALYREHFVTVDPIPKILEQHPLGTVLQSDADFPDNYRAGEFFNDYIKPQQMDFLAGSILTNNESHIALLGVQRPESIGRYSAREMLMLEIITPHMQRAVQLNQQLNQMEEKVHLANKALDRLPIGVVFVDANARPLYVNRKFEKLMGIKCLTIKCGKLVASTASKTNQLNKLIYQASSIENKQGGSITIENEERSQSLNILVTPVSPSACSRLGNDNAQVVAALFISTVGQQRELPVTVLKELYGLTNAEAQLAASLANGESLDSYADKQGVSKNTLRNQLKACFNKTGVNRQAELVTLVLSGIPALSEDATNFSFDDGATS